MGGMTANMTDKDKKLLIFLAFFAVVAIFGFLIIRPLVQKNAEMIVKVSELEDQKTEFERKKKELPMLRVQNTENQQEISKLKSGFEDMMQSQEIDNLLTEKALAAGLMASDLSIEMPKEPLKLDVYANSSIALAAEPTTEETTYIKKAEADADAVAEAAGTSDTEEKKSKKGSEIGQQTLVSAADIKMTMKGSIDTLKQVVDDYSNNTPAIRVSGVSWSTPREEGGDYSVELSLQINMCEKDDED
jgi:type II secretory pathway component PulM